MLDSTCDGLNVPPSGVLIGVRMVEMVGMVTPRIQAAVPVRTDWNRLERSS